MSLREDQSQVSNAKWARTGTDLMILGSVYLYQGQSDRAIAIFREARASLDAEVPPPNVHPSLPWALELLGLALLGVGDHAGAAAAYRRSLLLSRDLGSKWTTSRVFVGLAALSAARGDGGRAVRLLAAADAMLDATGYVLPPFERSHFEQVIEDLRRSPDPEEFARAWDEGYAMAPEEAIEFALSDQDLPEPNSAKR